MRMGFDISKDPQGYGVDPGSRPGTSTSSTSLAIGGRYKPKQGKEFFPKGMQDGRRRTGTSFVG